MKANERQLSEIILAPAQYVIPVFQRYYVWEDASWNRLWEDLTFLIDSEEKNHHFLGSIVCIPELNQPGSIPAYQVIDGQQRLITLSILLCAIRDSARNHGWEQLAAEIEENYLIHRFRKGRERYKIYPRTRDRERYIDLIDQKSINQNNRIILAYEYFIKSMQEKSLLSNEQSLRNLFITITDQLDFVVITLQGENPYKIFSSLNSAGVDLEQGDLIRNHVFMSLSVEEQDIFDDNHWHNFELCFEKNNKIDSMALTAFFRNFLMMAGEYVLERDVFDKFIKKYPLNKINPQELVIQLNSYSKIYNIIRGQDKHTNNIIQNSLKYIQDLSVGTSYPTLLFLFDLYNRNKLKSNELSLCLEAISGFVLRRYICKDSNRRYGNWFSEVCKILNENTVENLLSFLRTKGWPSDEDFINSFTKFDLYLSKYSRPILQGLETHLQALSEPVGLENCSIEHVMPQTIDNNEYGSIWIKDLGNDWERVHRTWLHTPGNLTLVGYDYNIDMRNKPFAYKVITLSESKVYLNNYFSGEISVWNEDTIQNRGIELAKIASKVWMGPDYKI